MQKKTQCAAILEHLLGGSILSPFTALRNDDIRTLRLAARIHDLRKDGYNIRDGWMRSASGKHRYKAYWMDDK